MTFEDDERAGGDRRFAEELRRALQAEDPGDAFTQRVLDRLTIEAARPLPASSPRARPTWRIALPFAALLTVAAGGAVWLQHARYVEQGERARAQVLMALRLTSEKLNIVRSAVIETQEPR